MACPISFLLRFVLQKKICVTKKYVLHKNVCYKKTVKSVEQRARTWALLEQLRAAAAVQVPRLRHGLYGQYDVLSRHCALRFDRRFVGIAEHERM